MAEEAAVEEHKPGGTGGMVQMLISGIGIFVIVTASNVVTNMFMPPAIDLPGADGAMVSEADTSRPPIYHPLNPPLIANIDSDTSDFLQISIEIMARDQLVIDAVQTHAAAIRNNLLLMFAAQTDEDVNSRDAKEILRQKVLVEVQSVLEPYIGKPNVEEVYFTSFVAQ
jgi:flagellar basal body-associated protein FliL